MELYLALWWYWKSNWNQWFCSIPGRSTHLTDVQICCSPIIMFYQIGDTGSFQPLVSLLEIKGKATRLIHLQWFLQFLCNVLDHNAQVRSSILLTVMPFRFSVYELCPCLLELETGYACLWTHSSIFYYEVKSQSNLIFSCVVYNNPIT